MTCTQVQDRLGDYIEGTLVSSERQAIEQHLSQCRACATLADDLGRVRQLAASLDRLYPPPGAWARIARETGLDRSAASAPSPAWKVWMPVAVAACLVLAATVVYLLKRPVPVSSGAGPTQAAATVTPADRPELQTVAAEMAEAEQHYDKAIAALEKLANDRQALDPAVAAKLQQSFEVVDKAIAESRAALKAEPTSEQAQVSLFEAFRTKIALLQDTVALINEMRKGNQAGAARIAEGLNKS